MKTILTCPRCGKTFEADLGLHPNRKFCSVQCRDTTHRTKMAESGYWKSRRRQT